jgi:hypothetical protein
MVAAKKVSDKVARDLHTLHNPFAGQTSQPKIPDGKVNDSMGFTAKDVFEFKNAEDEDTIDILLYAGRTGMMIYTGSTAFGTRSYETQQFSGAGVVDWTEGMTAPMPSAGFLVEDPERYGLWRVVSTGMQLKLMNSLEENDGWWEAIRVSEAMDSAAWWLTTGPANYALPAGAGLVAPVGYLTQTVKNYDLPNHPTYSTGLLRDLINVQFELHGRMDYHDFKVGKSKCEIEAGDGLSYTGAGSHEVFFDNGRDSVHEMVDNFVDSSYDMIFIRLHCRQNVAADPSANGSRFHCHLITNQEIYFPGEARENRYQTKCDSIGSHLCSIYF